MIKNLNYYEMRICLLAISIFFISLHSLPDANLLADNIVVLRSKDIGPYNQAFDGFKSASKATFIDYLLKSSPGENRAIVDKIKSNPPDLILTIGSNAALLLKGEIDHIPILFCMVVNPEKHSFAGEKNITGITLDIPVKEQMLKLKAVIPYLKTLGVIYDPENSSYIIEEAEASAKGLGINLAAQRVESEKEVPKAIRRLIGNIDALWLIPDSTVLSPRSFKYILLSAFENNLPVMVYSEQFVKAGALLSLSPDYFNIGVQAARLASEIIRSGRTPPITGPEAANLTINLKTASKMGINIPDEIRKSAEKVFK